MISITKPMTLMNTEKNQPVVVFPKGLKGPAKFSPKYIHIEKYLTQFGLLVPDTLRQGGLKIPTDKKKICYGEANFGLAFYELYYRNTMNPTVFKWIEGTQKA